MKVIWAKSALEDMLEIQSYLEERSPPAAWKTIDKIVETVDALLKFPRRGRVGRSENTREYIVQDLPYIIVYVLDERTLGISRILHTSRLWPPE